MVYTIPGAYGPPKDHAICQVPSQSKFITKYFLYKENEILLFEGLYGLCMMTKQQWRIELLCTTEECSPSKRAHPKGCLEELDGRTPKLVRLDNEDEGTPSRSKRHT